MKYEPQKQKYHSLTQFKKELEKNDIKVKSFDGHSLTTKDSRYTLYNSELIVKPVSA